MVRAERGGSSLRVAVHRHAPIRGPGLKAHADQGGRESGHCLCHAGARSQEDSRRRRQATSPHQTQEKIGLETAALRALLKAALAREKAGKHQESKNHIKESKVDVFQKKPRLANAKLGWAGHRRQKIRVWLGLREAAQQEFHGFNRRKR